MRIREKELTAPAETTGRYWLYGNPSKRFAVPGSDSRTDPKTVGRDRDECLTPGLI